MFQDYDIDLSKHKFTSRLIIQQALKRDWHVTAFDTSSAIMLISIPGRSEPIKIFSSSPSQMSYTSVQLVNNKYITNKLLDSYGVAVPGEILYRASNPLPDDDLNSFLDKYTKVVVKPLDAAHGRGITTNIESVEELKSAIGHAIEVASGSSIIIQEQIEGTDVRILTMNYKFEDSMLRTPASVIGDGVSNIEELMDITNKSDDRGEQYKARLNVIPIERAKKYLGKDNTPRVPKLNELVPVLGISNIGTGGTRENVKQRIPASFQQLAEKVSQILELPVCGVDFMIKQPPEKNMSLEDLQPVLIEANACPSLTMYEDLHSDEQIQLIDKYLDLLSRY